ncbi:hypothetical protein T12_14772 [Trichinella patagoniensis]|uniref:Uncharacterized protein n=1 Tax=Trichinella patagoniensis TaxID=990121 RepID=A0A0V0ZRS0_9BILA|nr:hypothetical protein T12_14772 [Trichinella patagoniensis]
MLEIAQSIVLTEVEIAGRENALSCGILCSPTTVYLWKINDRVEVKLKVNINTFVKRNYE